MNALSHENKVPDRDIMVQYRTLITLYTQAKSDGKPSFFVQDAEILTDYGKYLIEYLRSCGAREEQIITLKCSRED